MSANHHLHSLRRLQICHPSIYSPEEQVFVIDTNHTHENPSASSNILTFQLRFVDRIAILNESLPTAAGFTMEAISESLRIACFEEDGGSGEICVICQAEYERGARLGLLDCNHPYHLRCIQPWLLRNRLCPLCKATALRS